MSKRTEAVIKATTMFGLLSFVGLSLLGYSIAQAFKRI
jgi:hypothetical protein